MGYIEKERDGEFFNPTSQTVKVNPDCDCECGCNNPSEDKPVGPIADEIDNKNRWAWIVDAWNTMSFREKMKLFIPRIEYLRTSDYVYGDETDEAINEYIVDACYIGCRTLRRVQYDVNDQGVPCILIILNAIDPYKVPDAKISESMRNWAARYGFI